MPDNYESINVTKNTKVPDAPGAAPSAMTKAGGGGSNDNYEEVQIDEGASKMGGGPRTKMSKMSKMKTTTKSAEVADGGEEGPQEDYEVVAPNDFVPEAPPMAPADAPKSMITGSSRGDNSKTDKKKKKEDSKEVKELKKKKCCNRIKIAFLIIGIVLLSLTAIGITTFIIIVILHATKHANFIEAFEDLSI